MLQKICFLVNTNQYDSKRHFVQRLAAAFERDGVQTTILDTDEWTQVTELQIKTLEPDFTCSFNEVMPSPDGRFMWDELQIPHLALVIDPAIYYMHLAKSSYAIITCVDRFDCDLLRSSAAKNVIFLPHATEPVEFDPKAPREYEAVLLGSLYDPEGLRKQWQEKLSPELAKACDIACELVLSDNRTHFVEALWKALAETGQQGQQSEFLNLCFYVDYYLRGKDRLELVRSLKDVELHIFGEVHGETEFGNTWDTYVGDMPNVHTHDPVSYKDSFEILKRAKFCLNSTPSFKNGTHERIFSGMSSGCVVATNDNLYFREFFNDGEDILLYQHGKWPLINEKIAALLKDEPKRATIAEAGRENVLQNHIWDARVATLQSSLSEILQNF